MFQEDTVGPEDVLEWGRSLASGSHLHVHLLSYGNMDQSHGKGERLFNARVDRGWWGMRESAVLNEGGMIASSQYLTCPCFTYVCIAFYITALAEMVEQRFKPKGIPPEQWPTPQVLRLSHPVAPPLPDPATPSPFGDTSDHAGEVARGTSHYPEGSTFTAASTSPANSRLGGDDLGKEYHRHQSLRYQPLNPNPSNSNSAVFFLCQVGCLGLDNRYLAHSLMSSHRVPTDVTPCIYFGLVYGDFSICLDLCEGIPNTIRSYATHKSAISYYQLLLPHD